MTVFFDVKTMWSACWTCPYGNFDFVRNGISTGLLLEMNSHEEPRDKPPGWRTGAVTRFKVRGVEILWLSSGNYVRGTVVPRWCQPNSEYRLVRFAHILWASDRIFIRHSSCF